MKKITLFLMGLMCLSASAQQRQGRQRELPQKEIGVQLYNYRDLIGGAEKYAANHVEVLGKLHEMGYTGVEAANYGDGKFYGVSPEQFRKDVEAAGLQVLSSHASKGLSDEEIANHDFKAALKWWKQAIKDHKAAGMKYIVTPWANVPKTLKEAQTICDYHNEIGKLCREAGIRYGYHNHSHEFQKVEDKVWYDYFVEHTDSQYVFFEMDVYWAVMAQAAPVHYFKEYPGRFTMLHIKDRYELGESGMVGFDAIFRAAKTAGLKDYIVEIEGTDGTIDIMEASKRSATFLRTNRSVMPSYTKDMPQQNWRR